jgi:hypothetical protein
MRDTQMLLAWQLDSYFLNALLLAMTGAINGTGDFSLAHKARANKQDNRKKKDSSSVSSTCIVV